ncbi:beta-4C adrenergic receptor-like [Tubulanus polymorphus]|uniref:beta-4C adrenergic receptor-like n=1 Tax=Tubulanus polymorphus TaxID=672921 RepID=UPI003DA6806F
MAGADLAAGMNMLLATFGGIFRSSLSNVPFCLLLHSFATLSLVSSCIHVVLIGINRYTAVKYPIKHKKHARFYTYLSICVGWAIPVLFTLLRCVWMVKSGFLKNTGCCNKFVINGTAYIITLTLVLALSVLLLLIIHVEIVRILVWKGKRQIAPTAVRFGVRQYAMAQLRTTIRVSVTIFFSFTICWMPYLVVEWYIRVHGPGDTILNMRNIVNNVLFINSSFNPIIYTVCNADFKKAFQSVLCCLKRRCQHQLHEQTTEVSTITQLRSNVEANINGF